MGSVPCEYCGKIFSFDHHRRDKKCCSNLCSVKLNYAQRHNFLTPYQKYAGIELPFIDNNELILPTTTDARIEEVKPIAKIKKEDASLKILEEAEEKLKKYKPYKN